MLRVYHGAGILEAEILFDILTVAFSLPGRARRSEVQHSSSLNASFQLSLTH